MYTPPMFKADRATSLAFAEARGFGTACAWNGKRPVASSLPFYLSYAEDGTLCSKVEGGQWFLARHPGHPIVTAALDPDAPQPTREAVAEFVAQLSLPG